jgi:ankyrin repeat protein
MTPLMYGSAKGLSDIVNYLTLRSKDLNQEDYNSLTILMHYVLKEDFKMAKKIITRGADINYVNKNG